MEFETLLYDVSNRVATITLNRPDALNATTDQLYRDLSAAFTQVSDDAGVGCVILTGAGRGFCAGADSKALEGHVAKGGYDPGTPADIAMPGYGVRPEFDATFAYHCGLSKPVVAAING
ncbi:MAG: enoyl-CoA hydratase, partial [Gammaproteobacteria bacterium]|nr:enoyl-CoA hydratase [Gammaproteobacteria bacterium]